MARMVMEENAQVRPDNANIVLLMTDGPDDVDTDNLLREVRINSYFLIGFVYCNHFYNLMKW